MGRSIPRVLTFLLVAIGWVFFRAANLGESLTVIAHLFSGPRGVGLWARWQVYLVLLLLALAILEERWEWFERLVKAPAWAYGAAMAVLLLGLRIDRNYGRGSAVHLLPILRRGRLWDTNAHPALVPARPTTGC
ncbi:MAG: hypothetical protein ABI759_04110 [Candidatus Solibacter sp.]